MARRFALLDRRSSTAFSRSTISRPTSAGTARHETWRSKAPSCRSTSWLRSTAPSSLTRRSRRYSTSTPRCTSPLWRTSCRRREQMSLRRCHPTHPTTSRRSRTCKRNPSSTSLKIEVACAAIDPEPVISTLAYCGMTTPVVSVAEGHEGDRVQGWFSQRNHASR